MFTDTTHHNGDGVRVTTLAQCFTTQCHHYFTTNGRFAVHVVVMAMLNLVPLWAYRLLNAVMFGLLWLLACRFTAPAKRSNTTYAVAWLLLLAAMPQPGLVMLTLVSYSVNYLWTGVAVLALLLALRRGKKSWWLAAYALFVGSLQESYSLPLCAALVVCSLCRRTPWRITIAFIIGTAIEVFAPGNLSHAAQGGGFTAAAIEAKLSALGKDLSHSIITPAVIATAMWAIVRRRQCLKFCNDNLLLVTATAAALALACATFTSPRQLTAPTLFVIIMLLQRVSNIKSLTYASTALVAVTIAVMGYYKAQIHHRCQTLLQSVSVGKTYAYPLGEATVTGNSWFARAYIPDPLCNRGLVTVGDKYTKQGLSRLRGGAKLTTILPMSPKRIAAQAQPGASMVGGFHVTTSQKPLKLAPPYECFRHAQTYYYITSK
jgi:hypothetical protein